VENNLPITKRDFIVEGPDSTCILTPEDDEGPFFILFSPYSIEEELTRMIDVPGMLIHKYIREIELGIDLLLDVQITVINTCQPIPGVYVDFRSANSTGKYSDDEREGTTVSGIATLRGPVLTI